MEYFLWGAALLVVVVALFLCVQVVSQFERGVVLTLGRFTSIAEPGLTLLIPIAQTMARVDMRSAVLAIDPQDVITSDNVSVKVTAVMNYKVVDAKKAVLEVEDRQTAITQLAQITLRSIIGKHALDKLLSHQDELNTALLASIERRAAEWGLEVAHVEIRSVDLDPSMVRAMAQEAEAERGRRARVITALGEFEAATKLAEAADVLSRSPGAMTLRSLATLKEIGAERNTTIIFPVSQDDLMGKSGASPAAMAALAQAVSTHIAASAVASAAAPKK